MDFTFHKHSFEILVHVDKTACIFMQWILNFAISQRCSPGFRSGNWPTACLRRNLDPFCFSQPYSFGQPVPISAFSPWLTVMEHNVVFCYCSPPTSRFSLSCILRCFSAHCSWKHGYLSYWSLSVSSIHSGHFCLISVINNSSPASDCPLTCSGGPSKGWARAPPPQSWTWKKGQKVVLWERPVTRYWAVH